jgi:predicted nucleic acid-binding protein
MRMSWAETHTLLNTLSGQLTIHSLTPDVHDTGLALAERHDFSTYNAMVVASALHARSPILWSEEMQHGMKLKEGLRILNPFRAA